MTKPMTSTMPEGGKRGGEMRKGPLLVATTGDDGTTALRAAHLLAGHWGTEVIVLSVVEPDPASTLDPQLQMLSAEYLTARMDMRQATVERQIREVLGTEATWPLHVRFGPAPQIITNEARALRASLIVMNRGRHDVLTRLFTGETTLRTIRRADRPVLAISGDWSALPRIAVIGIDFSPSSIVAARDALSMLADGATAYLVHVWSRSGSDHPSVRAQEEAYERQLPERFARVAELLEAPSEVVLRPISLLGSPVEQLARFAQAQGAELVAAGRRGHGFFERLLVGSVTTGLLRNLTRSILVTPEPSPSVADRLERSITGISTGRSPAQWAVQLDSFSRRNRGRRTVLEVDDPSVGIQVQATGHALLGVVYDPNGDEIEIMLGRPDDATSHLTHTIRDVTAVAVQSDPGGRDQALRITHRRGQALLTFLPEEVV